MNRMVAELSNAAPVSAETRTTPYALQSGGRFVAPPVDRQEVLAQIRQKWWPTRLLGLISSIRWAENAVPVVLFAGVLAWLAMELPGFLSGGNLIALSRQAGEVGFVALGMAIVVMVGGIDLSVGAIFALGNFVALLLIQYLQWPVGLAVPLVLLVGAAIGSVNGFLVGYLRLRAFLTTLISLIIFRAVYDYLVLTYGTPIAAQFVNSDTWNYFAFGEAFGFGLPFWICIILAVAMHFGLTRLRPGWHIMAIGGSRRAAHNAGVPVSRTVMLCYTASGALTALSSIFFAARLGSLTSDVGMGLEITVLTGVIVGGIRLGGGKGSIARALIGLGIVLLLVNGLTTMSLSGGIVSMTLATTLLLASLLESLVASGRLGTVAREHPEYLKLPAVPILGDGSDPVWRTNDTLHSAEILTISDIDSSDDLIFDSAGNLYVGSRHGDIRQFAAPDFATSRLFTHIGSTIMGMAFDGEGNMVVCAGEMGVFRVSPTGSTEKITDQATVKLLALGNGRRLRTVDDLDIASDGKIYFTENGGWSDLLKMRGGGRLLCFDPKSGRTQALLSDVHFPNGVCLAPDGRAVLFASTVECAVRRLWLEGPSRGQVEDVLTNLPAHPGNINRASDGNYWMALVGGRSPAIDLAWRMPRFRKRLMAHLAMDEWPCPQLNVGGVVKFSADGEILETLWNTLGDRVSTVTSVREHRGYLYMAGGMNNGIGRHPLVDRPGDPASVAKSARRSK